MAGSFRLDRELTPDSANASNDAETEITACESCPGKHVFLESGNTDGWIATDHVVVPQR